MPLANTYSHITWGARSDLLQLSSAIGYGRRRIAAEHRYNTPSPILLSWRTHPLGWPRWGSYQESMWPISVWGLFNVLNQVAKCVQSTSARSRLDSTNSQDQGWCHQCSVAHRHQFRRLRKQMVSDCLCGLAGVMTLWQTLLFSACMWSINKNHVPCMDL